jgi:[ribosomal protein S5]-alanine N-acetyltransferase
MQEDFSTERLKLSLLNENEDTFIFELLNTEGWIRFIGNRNIITLDDAKAYIYKIINNKNVKYWVIKLKETSQSVGIITLIKRDYLEHSDIGFAFLPQFSNKGYAFEAAKEILHQLLSSSEHKQILATTVKDNTKSIQLLERLGLSFEKEITIENEILSVYNIHNN